MNKKEKSQTDKLVARPYNTGAQFFHDQFSKAQVRLKVGEHREIWPCRSKQFKDWLAWQYYVKHDKIPSRTAVSEAINVLSGKARFEGNRYPLHNRVAFHDGAVYYDLADKEWRSVKVTPQGSKFSFTERAMKELIEMIAKALVDNPDEVAVNEVAGEQTTVFELRVAQSDIGEVIGKHGRTAEAIRTLLGAAGMKLRKRFVLEVLD